ncbi:MRP like family ATpase of the SIMIBI class of P-loop GTpases [Cryptosporidium sp. chipmunk genotype I]|uniref:MRP like family ATpase of the SIMIBI class of P-loop GTpases n=1 Tax=Cryptosporidium sp. chipmunk genotype I TaxID=1280935 RepID=UPI00351A3D1C|nr:MRP like family ATpase of the SIMIBI class of P-loop GTpases [Cryptosporidium sp. chipmunk genotype I]
MKITSNRIAIFFGGFISGVIFKDYFKTFSRLTINYLKSIFFSISYIKSNSVSSEYQTHFDTQVDNCVGIDSPDAGIAESCAGCPNASICASGQAKKKSTEKIENLSKIKNIILVLSGKGGVGKSTISTQISWCLSSKKFNVGLLDIDICGPSAPKMMGVQNSDVHISANGWSPVYVNDYLSVMSTAFLLPQSDDAVIWRGPKKNGLIKQFLSDVVWGELDFLIIDTPPGTSDEHLSIVSYLNGSNVNGALIVTTPQEIALQDVRKEINFCKKVGLNILGVVENMGIIFKNAEHDSSVKDMCNNMEVEYLNKIPWDEQLLYVCDLGLSICEKFPQSPSSIGIEKLVDIIIYKLKIN